IAEADSNPKRGAGKKRPTRRTRFTVWAVERNGETILLHTHRTNAVVRHLLERRRIPSLASAQVLRAEVPYGRSRFDFLMEEEGKEFFLEVKSVTLFGNRAALFPDAVTERGRHHILKLAELGDEAIKQGLPRPVVLFLIHSSRVDRFLPDYHTDLEFSRAFLEVRDRVRIIPVSVGWTRTLELTEKVEELPVPWEFLSREVSDSGAYLVLMKVEHEELFDVGRLGPVAFPAGWYIYVGSAMKNLTARINRHLRKRKKFHWHIDYLRNQAAKVSVLPIRSSKRAECSVARALSDLLAPHAAGFGSSDCDCATHLFFSPEKPTNSRAFHDFLERFRMPLLDG
ncbi:MAG: DNA/RNA nuclease SfsA, partial [Acidobacteriota bacterium]